MTINLPDKIYKFLIWISLFVFGFHFLDYHEKNKYVDTILTEQEVQNDDIARMDDILHKKNKYEEIRIGTLANQYGMDNPITVNEDIVEVNFKPTLSPDHPLFQQTMMTYNRYLDDVLKISDAISKSEKNIARLNSSMVKSNSSMRTDLWIMLGCIIVIALCIIVWYYFELKTTTVKQSEKMYQFCQSCGDGFTSMNPNGTNKDHTENLAFCRKCYTNGEFTEPALSKDEFISRIKEKYKDKRVWRMGSLLNEYASLERWKYYKASEK